MSRKTHHPLSYAKPVLRDVVIQPQAHTLARIKQPWTGHIPAVPAVAAPVAEKESRNGNGPLPAEDFAKGYAAGQEAGAKAGQEAGYKDGYQKGLEAGHRDGLEAGKLEGFKEGLDRGLEQGIRSGHEKAEELANARIQERLQQLDKLLKHLSVQIHEKISDAEDDMTELCFAAISRIVGDAVATYEGVREAVRHAVSQMRAGQLTAIHVHPDDLHNLQNDKILADWLKEHHASQSLRWIGDKSVMPGGAILRTAEGTLDARLETQLRALKEVLLSVRMNRAAQHSLVEKQEIDSGPGRK